MHLVPIMFFATFHVYCFTFTTKHSFFEFCTLSSFYPGTNTCFLTMLFNLLETDFVLFVAYIQQHKQFPPFDFEINTRQIFKSTVPLVEEGSLIAILFYFSSVPCIFLLCKTYK